MNKASFFILWLLCSLVYFFGLAGDVMGVDSSLYAVISREMAQSGSFLEVTLGGQDYLDKPPLLFWISALFFKLFGVSNWSFKLAAFLFSQLGVYATYRLGRSLYSAPTGLLAAIILYSAQASFLASNDLSTESLLGSSLIFAIWQWYAWLQERRWLNLVGTALGLALGMLTAGPTALLVPLLAMASYLLGEGRLADLFRWQYLLLMVMILLFLSPMLYGLYIQFDTQPYKTVGLVTNSGIQYRTGVSGLGHFFWNNTFGRMIGDTARHNEAGAFFYVHTFLWSFLPWSLLFIMAFFTRAGRIIRGATRGHSMPELLSIGGFSLGFIILSISTYKLPQDIFLLYPLAAILLAAWWQEWVWRQPEQPRLLNGALALQLLVLLTAVGFIYLLYFYIFPAVALWKPILSLLILVGAMGYFLRYRRNSGAIMVASVILSLAVNFSLNAHFYPRLLQYQSGRQVVDRLAERGIPAEETLFYHYFSYNYLFYAPDTRPVIANDRLLEERLAQGKESYLIVSAPYLSDVAADFNYQVIDQIKAHSVTLLDVEFLNPTTRQQSLHTVYIIKILDER